MHHLNLTYVTDIYTFEESKYTGKDYGINKTGEFCKKPGRFRNEELEPVKVPSKFIVNNGEIYTKPGIRLEYVTGFGRDFHFQTVEERNRAYTNFLNKVENFINIKNLWK